MMTSFVGVDLHRNNFTYCIRENGEEKKIGKCEISDLKGFASLLGKNERRFTSEDFKFDADQGKAGSVAYRLEKQSQ